MISARHSRAGLRTSLLSVVGICAAFGSWSAYAQSPESAWTHVAELDSVDISYIMYRRADNENNGVVVKLINRRRSPVDYEFEIIFRATVGREEIANVMASLVPAR